MNPDHREDPDPKQSSNAAETKRISNGPDPVRKGFNKLTENEKLILGREAHADDDNEKIQKIAEGPQKPEIIWDSQKILGGFQVTIGGKTIEEPQGNFKLSYSEINELLGSNSENILKVKISDKVISYYDIPKFFKEIREEFIELKSDGKLKTDETGLKNGNIRILSHELSQVNPAIDILPDGTLILTQPFSFRKTETQKVGKKEITLDVDKIGNLTINSGGDFFELNESELAKRKLIGKIPDVVFRSRWSLGSRLKFLEGENQTTDPYQTFLIIRSQYEKFIDFGQVTGASSFNAIYSILTYYFILFDTIPYVKVEGLKGSGKTKLGSLHSLIDFNALMSVSMSPASIFRAVQDERATLIVDEAENFRLDNEAFLEVMPIFNSGYQKNGIVPRIETMRDYRGDHRGRVNYSTYSPKIICSINAIFETLRDRSYRLTLIKTEDKDKANISPNERDPVWQGIRDQLYVMLIQHYKKIQELSNSNDVRNSLELIGRDWDKAKPILTIAHFIDKYAKENRESITNDIIAFLRLQKEEVSEEGYDTFESTIIEVLTNILLEELKQISDEERKLGKVIDIQLTALSLRTAEREGIDTTKTSFNKVSYAKKVSNRLRNMGLKKNTKSTTGNYTTFESNLFDVINTARRYNIENLTLTTLTVLLTSPILTTLTTSTLISTLTLENLKNSLQVKVSKVVKEKGDGREEEGNYFKILSDCSVQRKGKSRILKSGSITFLYHNEAVNLVQKGLVALACPNGVFDPLEKICILNSENQEQDGGS